MRAFIRSAGPGPLLEGKSDIGKGESLTGDALGPGIAIDPELSIDALNSLKVGLRDISHAFECNRGEIGISPAANGPGKEPENGFGSLRAASVPDPCPVGGASQKL
jgi:hypothetical protein